MCGSKLPRPYLPLPYLNYHYYLLFTCNGKYGNLLNEVNGKCNHKCNGKLNVNCNGKCTEVNAAMANGVIMVNAVMANTANVLR